MTMTDDIKRIADGLTKAEREALLFFDKCDLPEAENADEILLIHNLMEAGLAGMIRANGRVFMDCQPFGLQVRAYLQENTMEIDLLPCPFCGSTAEIEHASDHHGEWFSLGCSRHWGHQRNPDHTNTCIAGRIYYTETDVPEPEAIAAWNQRATPPAQDTAQSGEVSDEDIVEALRCARAGGYHYEALTSQVQIRASKDVTAASIMAHAHAIAANRALTERLRVAEEALMDCWLKHDEPAAVDSLALGRPAQPV